MKTNSEQDQLFLSFLMESVPDRIYFKDTESRFLRVNQAVARLFNLENPEDVIGKVDADFFPDADAQRMRGDEQEILRTGQPIVGKVGRQTLPRGGTAWTLTTKMPLRDGDGRIIGTAGISKDITEIRMMEEALESERNRFQAANEQLKVTQAQLVEAEKSESIARLAVGVAHEIKNPLAVLGMGLDYLATARDAEGGDPVLKEMREAVKRADTIITELLALSTTGQKNLSPTSLQSVLELALESLNDEIADTGIRVVREYDSALPPVNIDPDKVERAFFCLLQNAIQAMDAAGVLTVRTGSRTLGEEEVSFDPGFRSATRFRAGQTVAVVEIDDTGAGIAEENFSKIYEAFFTTKPTGKGTGLGLTVCRRLFEVYNAVLEIGNRPEGGVRASVMFHIDES